MKKSLARLTCIFLLATAFSISGARAADPVIVDPSSTTIGVITGGDPGEGLDLQGNFIYALAIGAGDDALVKVGDASFQPLNVDEVPGATLVASSVAAHWYEVVYGDTEADLNLSLATSSIRYQGPVVELTLDNLEVGAQYKLQLMFGEQCCNRGFGLFVDDVLVVGEFNPGLIHGGIGDRTKEALITHTFFAKGTSVNLKLDVRAASYPDPNPILNAATLELVARAVDSDGDGLFDSWEQQYFNNLAQTGSGDPDNDGLTNAEELAAGSDPTKADTDGDGLNDGPEVKTYKTSPTNTDTDGDGLKDGDEVNIYKSDPAKKDTDGDLLADGVEVSIYKTDPTKADTDGDGFSDYAEIHLLTNPLDANSKPKNTTANLFTGPDAGQGLDLSGTFPYAISFGNADRGPYSTSDGTLTDIPPFGKIHDALFTADNVEGVTTISSQVADNWNVDVNFGDTPERQALSSVMASIRWSDAGNAIADQDHRAVNFTLSKLEIGALYKLQLLFGERLWARGFDVTINGKLAAKEFAPFQWQGGFVGPGNATPRTNGVVLTYTFVATSTNATVLLDGRPVTDQAMADHNAIINGATLELLEKKVDSDNDGLSDQWENYYFGNLAQDGNGDPDGDGLKNSDEYVFGSDPTLADADGDGLSDSAEKTAGTNPNNPDSDNDGISDYVEVNSTFSNIVIQSFSGGDPGEGLDLQGTFRYAVNVSTAGAAGKAGDADFTADTAPGVTVTAPSNIPAWDTPEYGDSPADDVIEKVTQSIRFGPTVRVELTGLIPGSTYKLQLLFFEQCCGNRGFNVYADGKLLGGDFSPPEIQGGVNNIAAGAVMSAEFVTQLDKVVIVLTVNGRTREDLTDPNAILDGLTLEALQEVAQSKFTGISLQGANVVITWTGTGTLQSADAATGPYADVAGATSPRSVPVANGPKYYRFKP